MDEVIWIFGVAVGVALGIGLFYLFGGSSAEGRCDAICWQQENVVVSCSHEEVICRKDNDVSVYEIPERINE